MSLFSRMFERRSGVADQAEARAITPHSQFAEAFSTGGKTHSGVVVSQQNAMQSAAVYTCVRIVSEAVATLPADVVMTVGERRMPVSTPPWLKSPNPFDTPVEFWTKVMTSLLMDGNAFIRIVKAGNGRVVALMPLNPRMVRVDLSEDQTHPVYKFDDVTLPPRDVLHIKGLAVADGLRGLSPIDEARQLIGAGMAVEEFGARFFEQGAHMGGIIEHPGKATPGEVAVIAKMMKKRHGGVANSHAIGVLSGGATFKPLSVTPENAQFLETQKLNRASIAALFGVPTYMLDPEVASSWGSGVEEQHHWFVSQTIQPWLTRLEQAFSAILPDGHSLRFNVNARIRVKLKERYEAHEIGIRAGFITINEVRAMEDREPIREPRPRTDETPPNGGDGSEP